jgi:excisionase family DNA binding protein
MGNSAPVASAMLAQDNENSGWISVGEAANILSLSSQTIREYCRLGHLEFRRSLGGHRRVNRQQIVQLLKGDKAKKVFSQKILIYTRVSTRNQLPHLKTQTKRLKEYAAKNFKGLETVLFEECASGFNESRPKFQNLLRQIMSGVHDNCILLFEHKDRAARWNLGFIELICEFHNVRIIYVEQNNLSEDEQWQHDLVSFITFYSSKAYSSRTAKRRAQPPSNEVLRRGIEIINSGVSFNNLCAQLQSEGYDCTENQARKYIWQAAQKLGDVVSGHNSGAEYRKLFIKTDNPQARIYTEVVYEDYCKWATKNHYIVQTRRMFGRNFHDIRAQGFTFRAGDPLAKGRTTAQCYWGLEIKGKKLHYISEYREERLLSPVDYFLKWMDSLKGQSVTTRNLLDRYNKYCKAHEIHAMTPTEVYRAVDNLCESKQASDVGFIYKF